MTRIVLVAVAAALLGAAGAITALLRGFDRHLGAMKW